jgi:hypothetical protein
MLIIIKNDQSHMIGVPRLPDIAETKMDKSVRMFKFMPAEKKLRLDRGTCCSKHLLQPTLIEL